MQLVSSAATAHSLTRQIKDAQNAIKIATTVALESTLTFLKLAMRTVCNARIILRMTIIERDAAMIAIQQQYLISKICHAQIARVTNTKTREMTHVGSAQATAALVNLTIKTKSLNANLAAILLSS